MRFKSQATSGYTIYAVAGINTVSFAIDFTKANTKGLLGFSVERLDPEENERYFMPNLKVFKEVIPHPTPFMKISSYDHPVQSFVWDDFTAKDGRKYEYIFYPVKGKPKKLDRSAKGISIKIKTEKRFDKNLEHEIYFNRGVASSQAYAREFGNIRPDKLDAAEQQRAFKWLGRGLDEAILRFIKQAKKGDQLLCAFYEFRYLPVAEELKAAIKRGVKVRIIYDAKLKKPKKDGTKQESFPREENMEIIKAAKLPANSVIKREANEGNIHHNKFMVLVRKEQPIEVFTGSANISQGGIFGQTNVGHWVRNADIAAKFVEYWELLKKDPGAQPGGERSQRLKDNNAYRALVSEMTADLSFESIDEIPDGITPIFSPRSTINMLKNYARMIDEAAKVSCITLAFGVNAEFKELLKDNTHKNQLVLLLLEKMDKPNAKSKKEFIKLGAWNNVYQSYGAYIDDELSQFAMETDTRGLKLNTHVAYIHSKFLLMDPLSATPVVVAGSANFSEPSTRSNDENMLIIKGDKRVADIYFTEFMRIFNHYYFRSVYNSTGGSKSDDNKKATPFIDTTGKWLDSYKEGKLRYKRVKMFAEMDI